MEDLLAKWQKMNFTQRKTFMMFLERNRVLRPNINLQEETTFFNFITEVLLVMDNWDK
jgi:hypothetical protein